MDSQSARCCVKCPQQGLWELSFDSPFNWFIVACVFFNAAWTVLSLRATREARETNQRRPEEEHVVRSESAPVGKD
jgi:hypothetical protein